jgi:hypothetical protein
MGLLDAALTASLRRRGVYGDKGRFIGRKTS